MTHDTPESPSQPTPTPPPTSSSGDDSVTTVLDAFAVQGWTTNQVAQPDTMLWCGSCESTSPADSVEVRAAHRVEGSSDPASMQIVVGSHCPNCGSPGVMVLGYGPQANADDQAYLSALTIDTADGDIADPVANRA